MGCWRASPASRSARPCSTARGSMTSSTTSHSCSCRCYAIQHEGLLADGIAASAGRARRCCHVERVRLQPRRCEDRGPLLHRVSVGTGTSWRFTWWRMRLSAAVNAAILLLLVALVFVPIGYVYPSRTVRLRRLTVASGLVWGAMLVAHHLAPAGPTAMAGSDVVRVSARITSRCRSRFSGQEARLVMGFRVMPASRSRTSGIRWKSCKPSRRAVEAVEQRVLPRE